ncbi:hypothetical protein KI387_012624 [Taxus chinensis]|uniref:AAA+ ATPase At3g28540-like C-terminal domain-containing protein n=1 Tax=Taxus chinensis TaxID=29808 RepID=A0AA38CGN3_TAXCH|nr:hypothetical protein KI387_012624 [Taxus chinensis]
MFGFYLPYGPRGRGNSSLFVAIVNYMIYDVYHLEFTWVTNNTELRALLIQTKEKSVIIIEDVDCSLNLTDWIVNPPEADENISKIEEHPLFLTIVEKLESGAEMTSFEITEVLMNKMENLSETLNDVICALDAKKKEKEALIPSYYAQTTNYCSGGELQQFSIAVIASQKP